MKHIFSLFFLLLFGSAIAQTIPVLPTKPKIVKQTLLKPKPASGKTKYAASKPKPTNFPEMVLVQGGSFSMGSVVGDIAEKPVHTVSVSSFSMGKYEVTVVQYRFFCTATSRSMPDEPSWGWNDKDPIVNVNYDDANAYCSWLSERTGKYYRLPSEAEWEYAARGGQDSNNTTYSGSDDLDQVGWYTDNSKGQAQTVGRKRPNELGLYDMSGNVWEWCKDWYDEGYYAISPSTNPKGLSSGSDRVLRGGSYDYNPSNCRVAYRTGYILENRDNDIGFRAVVPQ